MPLENLVCDRELAEKLKSLGYPQESVFWWFEDTTNLPEINYFVALEDANVNAEPICTALTEGELGEKLPASIKGDEMTFDLNIWKSRHWWYVAYWWDEDGRRLSDMKIETIQANTLVNAMAKMWIFLREQGLIQF